MRPMLALLLFLAVGARAQVGTKVPADVPVEFPVEMYCQEPVYEIYQRYILDSLKHVTQFQGLLIEEERAMFRAADYEYKTCDSLRREIQKAHEKNLKELEKTYKEDMSNTYLRADELAKRLAYHQKASERWRSRFWKLAGASASAFCVIALITL